MDDSLESRVDYSISSNQSSSKSASSKKSQKKPLKYTHQKSFYPADEEFKEVYGHKRSQPTQYSSQQNEYYPQYQNYGPKYSNRQNNPYNNQKYYGNQPQGNYYNKRSDYNQNYYQHQSNGPKDYVPSKKDQVLNDNDVGLMKRIENRDKSYEMDISKTQRIANRFEVDPSLVGFGKSERYFEEGPNISSERILDGLSDDDEEKVESNKLESKRSAKPDYLNMFSEDNIEYSLIGERVLLHNVKSVKILQMKLSPKCVKCTFLRYFTLKKKNCYFEERKCKVCKNNEICTTLVPTRITDESSNALQVKLGGISVSNAKELCLEHIYEIDFLIKSPIKDQFLKKDGEPIVSYNGACNQWNCYNLLIVELKKLLIVPKPNQANGSQSKLDKTADPEDDIQEITMHKPPPSEKDKSYY